MKDVWDRYAEERRSVGGMYKAVSRFDLANAINELLAFTRRIFLRKFLFRAGVQVGHFA
jgi:hypothetical protein